MRFRQFLVEMENHQYWLKQIAALADQAYNDLAMVMSLTGQMNNDFELTSDGGVYQREISKYLPTAEKHVLDLSQAMMRYAQTTGYNSQARHSPEIPVGYDTSMDSYFNSDEDDEDGYVDPRPVVDYSKISDEMIMIGDKVQRVMQTLMTVMRNHPFRTANLPARLEKAWNAMRMVSGTNAQKNAALGQATPRQNIDPRQEKTTTQQSNTAVGEFLDQMDAMFGNANNVSRQNIGNNTAKIQQYLNKLLIAMNKTGTHYMGAYEKYRLKTMLSSLMKEFGPESGLQPMPNIVNPAKQILSRMGY